jgi:TPR repeat protein
MRDRGLIKRAAALVLLLVAAWIAFSLLRQEPFERAEDLYARGEYVSAFSIYRDLARAGDLRAQFALSRFYEQGLGQNINDMRQALAWLQEAAERGYAPAQFRLGLFYYDGVEIEEDLEAAELWWGRAADQNLFEAWARLVRLYPLREGAASIDKKLWHMDENISRLTSLADRGEAFATVLLANFYALGAGTDENFDEAARLLRLAVQMGNANGQYSMGRLMMATGGDGAEALELLHLAADQGQVLSQLSLAEIYAAGQDVAADPEQALFWTLVALQRAAHMVSQPEKLMSERSRGLDSDVIEAVRRRARAWRAANQPLRTRAAGDLWK